MFGFLINSSFIHYSSFPFSFSCSSIPCNGCSALHGVNPYFKKTVKNALTYLIKNIYIVSLWGSAFLFSLRCTVSEVNVYAPIWVQTHMLLTNFVLILDEHFQWYSRPKFHTKFQLRTKTFLGFHIPIQVFTFYCRYLGLVT